jgi:hypothetical protein
MFYFKNLPKGNKISRKHGVHFDQERRAPHLNAEDTWHTMTTQLPVHYTATINRFSRAGREREPMELLC